MTNTLTQRLLATILAIISMQTAMAGDAAENQMQRVVFRHPATTGHAVDAANSMSGVERALLSYANGCATHDENAMAAVFTDFAVISYAWNITGRFIAGDAIADENCWAAGALTGTLPSESLIWIYPTGAENVVIVQYTAIVGTGTAQHAVQDVALIEMAGDRIARIQDYASRDDFEP